MVWEIQKWAKAIQTYGAFGAVRKFFVFADVKAGTLVGTDKYGNRYFENKDELVWGRDRWIDYNQKLFPRESSKIPPEWHAWLHRMAEHPPKTFEASMFYANTPSFTWKEHQGNLSGTDKAYRPYSTTSPKIEPWQPKV